MFASLEALDAEDNLQATPVTRQGAFQPKAKPRARKGVAVPTGASSSVPAPKAKSLPPPASNASDQHERNQIDVAKLQETTTEKNIESQSVGAAPEDFNKVGIETQQTHTSNLTDAPLIHGADPTESERNANFGSVIDCQAALAWHEPTSLAEVSVIETQESINLPPSRVLSEQDAIRSLSTLSRVDGLGFLTSVPHDPSPFDELIASCVFNPGEPSVEHVAEVKVPVAPSAFDELLASHAFKPVELAVEHAAEVGMQLVSSIEGLPLSVATETTGVSPRKKRRPRKERRDDSPLVEQGGQVRDEGALVVEKVTISRSEANPVKKKGSCDDANEQQETVSGEATTKPQKKAKRAKVASLDASAPAANVAQETMQEEIAAELAKKKKKTPQTQVIREEDGSNTIVEASSNKNKKGSTFTNTSQSAGEVALQISDAKESAQEALKAAAMKQETLRQFEEQQDSGEAHTSLGASKRKRKKPAKFLDGADDDEENITLASMKAISEAAKKKRRQAESQKDILENDLLLELFPNLPEKISKLKESKLATSTADAPTSQPPIKAGRKAHNPVTPTVEEDPKKKFKKCVQQRRRVERRAMNPADPDLDPKKMTMKDIIRLAEAKERMLKKDNAKKENDGNNQVTANEPESYESTCLAPQVQIVDGQIVINEQSLVINAHPKDDIRAYKRVEETHAKLNYHSYMKRTPTHTWRPDETELFYQALREFGTNFSMIQHLFPGRTRKQVLLKYKKEERCRPLRIDEAMRVKPCDTLRFLEVMSSLNLLSSEIPEELESGEGSAPMELAFSKEETEDKNRRPGGERQKADGAGCTLKLDESSVHSMNQENNDKSSGRESFNWDQPNSNQELIAEEPKTLNEEAKPCESPKKASSPPRKKKSLFSYQTSVGKS